MTFMVHWMDYREQQWKFFCSMEAKMNGQHYLSVIYLDINLQHKLQLQTLIKLCWCNCICQITSWINRIQNFISKVIHKNSLTCPNITRENNNCSFFTQQNCIFPTISEISFVFLSLYFAAVAALQIYVV